MRHHRSPRCPLFGVNNGAARQRGDGGSRPRSVWTDARVPDGDPNLPCGGLRCASVRPSANSLEFGADMTSDPASGVKFAGGGTILLYTRVLSAVIVPFLALAFVVLSAFPDQTAALFAWPIKATMTSMTLASAYLGGIYFFTRVALRERKWSAVSGGFVAVALFATLLASPRWHIGRSSATTSWRSGYGPGFTSRPRSWSGAGWRTPDQPPGGPDGVELSAVAARTVGIVGLLALLQGIAFSWRRRS